MKRSAAYNDGDSLAPSSWRRYMWSVGGASFVLIVYLVALDLFAGSTSSRLATTVGASSEGAAAIRSGTSGEDVDYDRLFPIDVGYKGPIVQGTPARLRSSSRVPNYETFVHRYTIEGQPADDSIEHYWGALSPYFRPASFGVADTVLPETCRIKQAHVLSRHGSRYPTAHSWLKPFGDKIAAGGFKASGPLSMLNTWKYELGAAILVPIGKEQLYRSGVLTSMQYGDLYSHEKSARSKDKLVFRSTSEERMTESALAFLQGFYGTANWQDHAHLELMIESPGLNNTLAPYFACPGANEDQGGKWRNDWEARYLRNRTEQLAKHITGIEWGVRDTAALQMLCAYETNAFGYSEFCELFTWQDWLDFDYAESLNFYGGAVFGAPSARAQGIGWVDQLIRRIERSPYDPARQTTQNATLDSSDVFFPLDQNLYVDFTHDTVIAAILTALEFTQFERDLPTTGPPALNEGEYRWSTSRCTPFAARLVTEIISCDDGQEYIHFLLNQRTLPIALDSCKGKGFADNDGWCRLPDWLRGMDGRAERAAFEENCYPKSK